MTTKIENPSNRGTEKAFGEMETNKGRSSLLVKAALVVGAVSFVLLISYLTGKKTLEKRLEEDEWQEGASTNFDNLSDDPGDPPW